MQVSKWVCCVAVTLVLAMPALSQAAVFLDNKTQLQDGDIILENTGDLISNMIEEVGRPQGVYTHAVLYLDLPKTGGRLISFSTDGLKIMDPSALSPYLYYAALVRPVRSPPQGSLATSFTRIRARPLSFDFTMQWQATGSPKTDCIGLISQTYRLAGLTDPFPPLRPAGGKTMPEDTWTKEHYGLDFSRIVSPNAVLDVHGFRVVATYKNKSPVAHRQHLISRAALDLMYQFMAIDHMTPKARLGDDIFMSLTGLLKINGVPVSSLSPVQRRAFLVIQEYLSAVKERVNRTIDLNSKKDWTDKSIVQLTTAVTHAYRSRYLKPDDGKAKP